MLPFLTAGTHGRKRRGPVERGQNGAGGWPEDRRVGRGGALQGETELEMSWIGVPRNVFKSWVGGGVGVVSGLVVKPAKVETHICLQALLDAGEVYYCRIVDEG